MPQFLFWCAFEHLDFRLPEFEAIVELFNINLKWIDRNQSHPWVIIELDSISDAKLIWLKIHKYEILCRIVDTK